MLQPSRLAVRFERCTSILERGDNSVSISHPFQVESQLQLMCWQELQEAIGVWPDS